MVHLPIAKLFGVLLRQVSKPIANVIVSQAKSSPILKKYICIPPATVYNWMELKSKMWLLQLGRPITIPVLNEEKMIELGANLIGEFIVFFIAVVVLINEVHKAAQNEARKEAQRRAEIARMKHELETLHLNMQQQEVLIKKLIRLHGSTVKKGDDSNPKGEPTGDLDDDQQLEAIVSSMLTTLLIEKK